GCESQDERLPASILKEAQALNAADKGPQARALYNQLIAQYPGTPQAEQARKDLFLIQAFMDRDAADRSRVLRTSMKRIMDALTRYEAKRGEYPDRLEDLVPDYLDKVPLSPWNHPFLYRAYVSKPIEDVNQRRGAPKQRFNTRRDAYELASLGRDAAPGGDGVNADILVRNGDVYPEKVFDPLPGPQPVR
ncbi:MAG TPA: hypothetical protein VJ483_05615, partial [Holophagaceae bacterium]|nr:hypothetical protein [Holophagaceae bacterium]